MTPFSVEKPSIEWWVPCKTKNPLNQREHWRKVSSRAAVEKETTLLTAPRNRPAIVLPCVVVLARFSTGKLDSHDALAGSLKHICDGVAEWVGVDDGEVDKIRFRYEQEPCRRGQEGVRVRVFEGARVVETIVFVNVEVR